MHLWDRFPTDGADEEKWSDWANYHILREQEKHFANFILNFHSPFLETGTRRIPLHFCGFDLMIGVAGAMLEFNGTVIWLAMTLSYFPRTSPLDGGPW
ncbi:hypothetical protein AUEXF2481DRAFT_371974 [Aureobasidium subglaciale EXF-2481]|uniref:Uncharacterized protein n=1 Tax=Aureobasidium subglaciale (strain EXF-2481) TaxID=1043005 RepID=A0A074YLN4_AURSE|nr:uncharacterized protein AUEXF2481DRAFT_371974 [Aureobasidium subglaciale EXF-2481]KEQ98703.1 hypothetical protein AUEXF2481DRAFT_371974 [Aureobasidium subglaciale EXF-2481]